MAKDIIAFIIILLNYNKIVIIMEIKITNPINRS